MSVNKDDQDEDGLVSGGSASAVLRSVSQGGNLIQFVVFLNGLILTIAAYFVLSIFIQSISTTNIHRTGAELEKVIGANTLSLEQSIRGASVVLSLSGNISEKSLFDRLQYAVPGLDKFDLIFFMMQSQGEWLSKEVIKDKDNDENILSVPLFSRGSEQSLYEYIQANRTHESDDIVVLTDLPGTKYTQEQAEPVVRGRPFVLAKILKVNGNTVMIVGVTSMARIIDMQWLAERDELKRISIRDAKHGRPIYYMDRLFRGEERLDIDSVQKEMILSVGNANWLMQMDTGKGAGMSYLEQLPLLVLLVGLIFTFLGTMFVRNNQKQSYRLTTMNRVLAQKNFEMNSQAAERDRLNQALRKTEREYRAIIDAVNDIIFETTTKGEIVFLNDSWERITGFSIDQSMGRNLLDSIHPQDQAEQRQNFEQMVRGKRHGYHFYTRLRTSEGAYRAVEMSISMLRQDENRNMRIVGTITDIEERRRAEKALGEAEKKYRAIVENAAGGIYQVTPEGQFLSANPAMAGILGYDSTEQMLREIKNAHTSLYVNSRERMQFIQKLESLGTVKNFEAQIAKKDSSRIWISESARAVKDDDGNVLYFEGSIENITKRKEVELKLREAKIQSDLASRAKSEFLANMSHELRTPLNAIIGFSEIIRNEVLGPVANTQYKEYVRDIYDSGKRLLMIINEILDVSRIETGQRQLNEGVVDMEKVFASCIQFMQPKADAAGLSIVNLTAGHLPQVIGEELAIKQIFLNLLSNAVKYTAEGGRITLSHELDREGQLRISVTDTGVGLDEAEIEKALSPFGQIETSFNRAGSGAGLGLTLVDSLIKLHGGRLELFSQKGIGTTATIVFPAKRVAQEQKDGAAEDDGRGVEKGGGFGDDDGEGIPPTRNLQ